MTFDEHGRQARACFASRPGRATIAFARREQVNTLNPDVYAGDVLRAEYRHQMDKHARMAEEIKHLRDRLVQVEAQQLTAAERAASIMETLARYGGMLAPEEKSAA